MPGKTGNNFPGKTVATIISLPSVILYFATLVLGLFLLLATPIGAQMLDTSSIQHLEFFFIFFRVPLSLNLFIPTVLAIGLYAACITVAATRQTKYWNTVSKLWAGSKITEGKPNWLLIMPLLASVLFVVIIVLSLFQESLGVPTGGLPPEPTHLAFAGLTTSPVSEEVCFRITTIGLIVTLRSLSSMPGPNRFTRVMVASFLSPENAKANSGLANVSSGGLRMGIHWTEWIMLGLSSIIFGLAHVSAGSGWAVGKITTAALAGFIMGLVFLVYGAYANILLHWFFNYYTQVALTPLLSTDSATFSSGLLWFLTRLDSLITGWTYFVGLVGLALIVWLAYRKNYGERGFSLYKKGLR